MYCKLSFEYHSCAGHFQLSVNFSGLKASIGQIKSNNSFTSFFQILGYTNKTEMAKHLQRKIICGETTCKKTLYKPRPHNTKIKNKLN